MTYSKNPKSRRAFAKAPIAAAILAISPGLMAQDFQLEEIVVTAQKREESLQDVPISVQALGGQTLTQLNVQDFNDYAKMLPSVQIQPGTGSGPGFSLVYMRGVTSGGDGQATTSLPSVGMYLDEQPLTTVIGNLDVHMYDIARVEALAGPQGTLYGASSQAGTIRIITNKPELDGFSASYTLEGNVVDGDDQGYLGEGYVNIPLTDNMAVRLVGWKRSDAGWIDNIERTRTFRGQRCVGGPNRPGACNVDPTPYTADDTTVSNSDVAEDNYNTVDTQGARASLRVDLNENWTITPTIMGQEQNTKGSFADLLNRNYYSGNGPDPQSEYIEQIGKNEVVHFSDEYVDDYWYQASLTIEGKIADFDLVYAGSYLNRNIDSESEYSDYGYFYDAVYSGTGFFAHMHISRETTDANGNYTFGYDPAFQVAPMDYFTSDDRFTKMSHELRLSSPAENRLRGTVGLFWHDQEHNMDQRFKVDGLTITRTPNGLDPTGTAVFENTVYLNYVTRTDEDRAIFGNVSFDITDSLTLDVGGRYFEPTVEVDGFFGFGRGLNGGGYVGWSGFTGERQCDTPPPVGSGNGQADYNGAPCRNVDGGEKTVEEDDFVGRVNLSWDVNDDSMVYATWSEGYRSGGINRNPAAGSYVSDFLTNWEFGWKSTWLDNRLQYNGAVFWEEWEDFQVAFQGANGITQVANGPTAEITGTEQQILWAATEALTISAAFALYDSELQDDYGPDAYGPGKPEAYEGSQLPLTADFKGNLIARYEFTVGEYDAHLQSALSYEGERANSLNFRENEVKGGNMPDSTFLDLAAGVMKGPFELEMFLKNATDEDAPINLSGQCVWETCGPMTHAQRPQPRTVGVRFTQNFD
jgi:outer membrane receptor protein involved in Fe transport